jgi:hypothetical protein
MPIVRISSVSAAVGSRFASRMGARGAVTSVTPTADLSHPIASQLVVGMDASVLVSGACTAADANDHVLVTAASDTCRRGLSFVR